ncbi:hypothetical protein [Phytohabitans rumicis]|uniref:PqqD family protein n=1 Tax=Phytohabitans rumicis TaxID=1076125 RepID=A0A6V8KZN9_9ACTN|nr:hypothetical protein [Phytohabitans rumicis]GFJ87276.1 hypothetical protein Prum_009180 [Phytohabitans rumicis]
MATVRGTSTVLLRRLAVRTDGADTIVGRVDSGEFIAVPPVGARALALLAEGVTVQDAERTIAENTGEQVDLAEFVEDLLALGFIAELDGHPQPGQPAMRVSLPWLRPRHVGWLLSRTFLAAFASITVAGLVVAFLSRAPLPSYHALLWSGHGSVVLVTHAAIGWVLLYLHELAHLAAARAAGVPGRIRLGTRLQFLVAETDVSGVWASPGGTA